MSTPSRLPLLLASLLILSAVLALVLAWRLGSAPTTSSTTTAGSGAAAGRAASAIPGAPWTGWERWTPSPAEATLVAGQATIIAAVWTPTAPPTPTPAPYRPPTPTPSGTSGQVRIGDR
jgi:hypothetical protein